jgi:hypothetical protein
MNLPIPECPHCQTAEFVGLLEVYEGIGIDGARPHDKFQEFQCRKCAWATVRTVPLDTTRPESSGGPDSPS